MTTDDLELEPVWTGAMERAGLAPGLSSYTGRSAIYHSASWAVVDGLEVGECGRTNAEIKRGTTGAFRRANPAQDRLIQQWLGMGCSYAGIARALLVSRHTVMRVGRRMGMNRLHEHKAGTPVPPIRVAT